MRNKQSVWIIAGLSALLLSGVVFADRELDVLMNPVAKPKVKAKPPHKVVKKHHHAKKVEVEPVIEQPATIPSSEEETRNTYEQTLAKINSTYRRLDEFLKEKDSIVSCTALHSIQKDIDSIKKSVNSDDKQELELYQATYQKYKKTLDEKNIKCADSVADSDYEWQTIDRYQVKDGLVKDTVTGLMWMRCSLGQNWDGSTCQGEAKKYTWDEAMKISNGFSYAGFNDWRVPTTQELKSLVYCSSGEPKTWNNDVTTINNSCKGDYTRPTIKTDAFPNTPNSWSWAWSSDLNRYNNSNAWFVNLYDGNSSYDDKSNSYAVRLVRRGQPIRNPQDVIGSF